MRDPERIDKYMEVLRELWKKVPDWRFSQLITNIISYIGRDPFYMEDEEFFTKVEEFKKKYNL